ncbi:alpha-galactosidase A-like [Dermacentor variabilis]|uniref:alpha-galactosidase A-like n=1 Tax=Dermacentor variabilis TaxID=34621 RepID=UPI003F5BA7C9
MLQDGYLDVGYEYLIIEDCWSNSTSDEDGRLFGDTRRCPAGMNKLAQKVEQEGPKFGIYTDVGPKTCDGCPGSYGHYKAHAQTFAAWGVDYVKMNNLDVWSRWGIFQLANGKKSLTMLVHNTKGLGGPVEASISLLSLSLNSVTGYLVTDFVRNNTIVGKFSPGESVNAIIAPMDISFFKATIL